jgi:hypothetical protein
MTKGISRRIRYTFDGTREAQCADCNLWKHHSQFYKNNRGYPLSYCKECSAVRARKSHEKRKLAGLRPIEDRIEITERQLTALETTLNDLLNATWSEESLAGEEAIERILERLDGFLEEFGKRVNQT